MADITFGVLSAVASIPQAFNNAAQFWSWYRAGGTSQPPTNASAGSNSEETQQRLLEGLRELQQRCLHAEAQVQHDNTIPSQQQRQTVLQLFAGARRLISRELELADRGLHIDQQSSNNITADEVLQAFSRLCESAEDAWRQTLARSTYCNGASPSDDEIGKIKEKLRKNQPLIASRASHIYSSTDRPPSIDFTVGAGLISPLVTLNTQQCFMEYFPFGSDLGKAKSRICWMMLLLQELRCPYVMEPVKVFSVAEGSQPGFYTCSKVPSHHEAAPASGELCTLDECVSRVHMDRKKVITHLSLAVQELHAQTILHKNICASNVVVDQDDNTWLAGLSSSRLGDQNSYRIPQEDMARAKMVYYDSPDVSGHLRSFKCDIYALGMVMLEVALGKSFVKSPELTCKADIFSLLGHRVRAGPFKALIYECLAPEARSRPFAVDISSALDAMTAQDIDCSQLTSPAP